MDNPGATAGSGRAEDFIPGLHLSIRTTFGEEFEGEIVMYDSATNLVVFQEPKSTGSRRDLRFLKVGCIEKSTALGQNEIPELHISPMDPSLLMAREEAAVRQATVEAMHLGKDVTAEAQELYDALRKTLPVRWEGRAIVVMDEVRISPPYRPEDTVCTDHSVQERVRKVVDNERKRLDAKVR